MIGIVRSGKTNYAAKRLSSKRGILAISRANIVPEGRVYSDALGIPQQGTKGTTSISREKLKRGRKRAR